MGRLGGLREDRRLECGHGRHSGLGFGVCQVKMTLDEIKWCHCNPPCISRHMSNIGRNQVVFDTQEKIDKLVHEYQTLGMASYALGKQYGVCAKTIRNTLNKHGLKTRGRVRYKTDEAYFVTIDTEAKAYFLGLMMADGCVNQKRGKDWWRISIGLNEEDGYILEAFARELKYDGKVQYIDRSGETSFKDYRNTKNHRRLQVSSTKLCQDLIRHGCIANKTYCLKWLKPGVVPEHLMHHFVRGFMDGDGWVTIGKGKKTSSHGTMTIGFCGTQAFMTGLRDYLTKKLGFNPRMVRKVGPALYKVWFGGNRVARRLVDWLYQDATIYLTRKRQVSLTMQARLEGHIDPRSTESPDPLPDILLDGKPSPHT